MAYLLTKTVHLVLAIAWMAAVFYLPRILVNLAEAGAAPAVRERLLLMGRRLYRFGHVVFAAMLVPGLALWMHFHMSGAWLHAKLALVALLFAYWLATGRLLKAFARGGQPMGQGALRWFNEVPLLLLVGIVWLVLAKPF